MTFRLSHHDLLSVPLSDTRAGIYWLRLYDGPSEHVAVITEVPGNPGGTATNVIERIVAHVAHRFDINPANLVVFEIVPRGAWGALEGAVHRVEVGDPVRWVKSSRSEIETMVGNLPDLPEHETLYRRVLGLGGGNLEERLRDVFEAVPVEELPPPHNPFNCTYRARFDRILSALDSPSVSDLARRQEAGRRFVATLTPSDILACPRHRGQWRAIADESAAIVQRLGQQHPETYVATASQSTLGTADRGRLASLFSVPIVVRDGSFIDGQHRGCAARFSGADRVAISTGDESLGQGFEDWTYEGGG